MFDAGLKRSLEEGAGGAAPPGGSHDAQSSEPVVEELFSNMQKACEDKAMENAVNTCARACSVQNPKNLSGVENPEFPHAYA